jgi:hypothetical protein
VTRLALFVALALLGPAQPSSGLQTFSDATVGGPSSDAPAELHLLSQALTLRSSSCVDATGSARSIAAGLGFLPDGDTPHWLSIVFGLAAFRVCVITAWTFPRSCEPKMRLSRRTICAHGTALLPTGLASLASRTAAGPC